MQHDELAQADARPNAGERSFNPAPTHAREFLSVTELCQHSIQYNFPLASQVPATTKLCGESRELIKNTEMGAKVHGPKWWVAFLEGPVGYETTSGSAQPPGSPFLWTRVSHAHVGALQLPRRPNHNVEEGLLRQE